MCYSLLDIERKLNIHLPEKYKKLYFSDFAEVDKNKLQIEEDIFYIKKFLTVTEIISALDEFYDFWGYDIVPIAEVEDGDYICLYYKDSRNNPIIVYWDYDIAIENSGTSMLFLYDNIEQFEIALRQK